MSAQTAPETSHHPTRASANRQAIFGSIAVVVGAAAAVQGAYGTAILVGGFGGLFAVLGVYTRRTGAAVQPLNKAVNLVSAGALVEAEALLDQVEAQHRIPYVLRAASTCRANIALRRGELEAALAHIDRAAEAPIGFPRQLQRTQVVHARGLRAFLRACTGDREGARADVERVRSAAEVSPEPLANAALAEVVMAERAGDHAALRELLAKHRRLLLEHTHPRERALVRAFQRMLKATTRSIYREGAPREVDARGQPSLVDWVAKIAPAAAPFVQAAPPAAGGMEGGAPDDAPIDPAAQAAAAERRKAPQTRTTPSGARVIFLWVLLIAMFMAIWQFLSPAQPGEEASASSNFLALLPLVVLGVGALGFVVRRIARSRSEARERAAIAAAQAASDTAEQRAARARQADLEARAAATASAFAPVKKKASGGGKTLVLWVLLILGFLAIWQFLSPDRPAGHAPPVSAPAVEETSAWITVIPSLFVLGVCTAFVAWAMWRSQKSTNALTAAMTRIALGDEAGGEQALVELAGRNEASTAASAHAQLAALAERRGDLAAALAHTNQGLAKLTTEQLRAAFSDLLVPALIAERAFVFAAAGNAADAAAEIEVLTQGYPSYATLAVARFRVALARKAREGDWAGAARVAAETGELAIGPRDELLADLARAAANAQGTSVAEVARLEEELRVDVEARRWIEAVAPGALEAFRRSHGAAEGVES
uniref:Uncharacterized protein n=1 Tax=Phaselicystis flava TaxID=525924 RepID=A0A3S7V0E1_9BACT|nr:hypothetical protein [Phaselicystis flava]